MGCDPAAGISIQNLERPPWTGDRYTNTFYLRFYFCQIISVSKRVPSRVAQRPDHSNRISKVVLIHLAKVQSAPSLAAVLLGFITCQLPSRWILGGEELSTVRSQVPSWPIHLLSFTCSQEKLYPLDFSHMLWCLMLFLRPALQLRSSHISSVTFCLSSWGYFWNPCPPVWVSLPFCQISLPGPDWLHLFPITL